MDLVASVADEDAAIAVFSAARPDLVFVDLDLSFGGRLNAILRTRIIDPDAWIIGLVMYEGMNEALGAGAAAVLGKHLIAPELLDLIVQGAERRLAIRGHHLGNLP